MTSSNKPLNVTIVGGGIGGLAAAIALRQHGHQVRVFEQAEQLSEVGAGLQVSPNSTRVLQHLGVGEHLARTGVTPERLESRDWQDGALLGTHVLNEDPPRYGAPHYLMRRSDLLDALVQAVPSDIINLGASVVGVSQDADAARVRLADGSEISSDVVIAADGIHSTISRNLFDPGPTTFSGTVAYRALMPAEKVADLNLPNVSSKWWGPVVEHHLVHYYVSGGRMFNIIAVVPMEGWETESWTQEGEPDELREAFKDYAHPIPELLSRAGTPLKWGLHVREPLERWTDGRVALLGDACHPMVPFLAQGAAMAIEDAAVLARCLDLSHEVGVPDALTIYERTRRERTSQIQAGARVDTPETWKLRDWIYDYDAMTTPLVYEPLVDCN